MSQKFIRGERNTLQYMPLDYSRQSIRLIRIIPKSIRWNDIRCELRHATSDRSSWRTTIDGGIHHSTMITIYVTAFHTCGAKPGTIDVFSSTAQRPGCDQIIITSYMPQGMYITQKPHKLRQSGCRSMRCVSINRIYWSVIIRCNRWA